MHGFCRPADESPVAIVIRDICFHRQRESRTTLYCHTGRTTTVACACIISNRHIFNRAIGLRIVCRETGSIRSCSATACIRSRIEHNIVGCILLQISSVTYNLIGTIVLCESRLIRIGGRFIGIDSYVLVDAIIIYPNFSTGCLVYVIQVVILQTEHQSLCLCCRSAEFITVIIGYILITIFQFEVCTGGKGLVIYGVPCSVTMYILRRTGRDNSFRCAHLTIGVVRCCPTVESPVCTCISVTTGSIITCWQSIGVAVALVGDSGCFGLTKNSRTVQETDGTLSTITEVHFQRDIRCRDDGETIYFFIAFHAYIFRILAARKGRRS